MADQHPFLRTAFEKLSVTFLIKSYRKLRLWQKLQDTNLLHFALLLRHSLYRIFHVFHFIHVILFFALKIVKQCNIGEPTLETKKFIFAIICFGYAFPFLLQLSFLLSFTFFCFLLILSFV